MSVSFGMDFDHHPDVKRTLDLVIQWFAIDAKQGKALVLAGHPGCGKSHICSAVYTASQGMSPRPVMWSESDLVTEIRASYNGDGGGDIVKAANGSGLLILDDIGVAHVKDIAWLHEIYWRLLNGRFERKQGTLVTTNMMESAFKERLGARAFDRLLGACGPSGFVSMFSIPSYRMREF